MKNKNGSANKYLEDKNLIYLVKQYIEKNQKKKNNFKDNVVIMQKSFEDSDLKSNIIK